MELPNYSKQLMQQLRTLRKEGQFCDCTVLVGDSSHRAHKVVLAASSMLFRSLIDTSDSISIDTAVVSSVEFECLLDMVYTGKLPPGKHNVSRIIAAADSLQMFDVAVGCKNILTTLMSQQHTAPPQSDNHTDAQASKLHSVLQPKATPSPKKGDLISRKVTTKAGPAGVQVRCEVEKAGSGNETGDEELRSESAKEEQMEEDTREEERSPCEIPGTQIDSQGDGPESTSSTDQAICKEEEAEEDDEGEEEESGEEEKKPKEKGGKRRAKVLQSEQPYSCRWCKKGFAYKCRMLAHAKRCPMSKEFKHQCLLCSEKLATPRALQRHRNEAHPDVARTKKKAVCDICGRTFAHPSGMIYHKRTEHFDEKPFACVECGAKFGANSSLKNHMRLHTGEKPYLCKHCDMTFTVAAALAYHTKKKHSEGKMYACQYCEALFAQSIELTRHVRTHTGDRPYVCRECGKGYSQASGLTVHLQTFHNISEPHDCQKCRLSFSSLEDHRQHIQECHPKDFKSSLGCPVCNKMFTSTALLEKHKSTHAGSKPFNCDICLKSYQQLSGLWYHNRTTHPEVFLNQSNRHLKPLVQCEVCFKFFPNSASLTRHHEAEHAAPEVSAVRCPFCPGVFPSEEELQEHAKTRHPSQEGSAFGCSLCPTVCASQHLLQEHFLTCHVAAATTAAAADDEQAEQGGGEEQESTSHAVIQTEQSASEGAETNISLEDQSQTDGSQQVLVALGDREDGGPSSGVVEVNVDDLLNGTVTLICGGNQ